MQTLSVPQTDGEIVITPGGVGAPRTYQVSANAVEVEDADVAAFLSYVDGAHVPDAAVAEHVDSPLMAEAPYVAPVAEDAPAVADEPTA